MSGAPGNPASPAGASRRIPSLDGLRAVSIALVVWAHASHTAGFPAPLGRAINVIDFGNLGVRVFFVISGFLITGLLLAERRAHGRIDLFRFYLRRTFRIFPPFYVFVGALAVAAAVGWIVVPHSDFVHALTYTVNYRHGGSWYVGHAWSLSVEEQFYLLWPAIIVLLGVRHGAAVALAFVAASPAIRLGQYWFAPSAAANIGVSFETVGDAIAIGCLLALARNDLWSRRWYRGVLESRWFALVPVMVLVAALADPHPRIAYALGITVKNVGVALCIDWCVRHADSALGRFLNAAPVRYVGVLSYSLYIWQEPFLYDRGTAWVQRFPQNVVLAAGCALASYYAVERPALRARARLEAILDARGRRRAPSIVLGPEGTSADSQGALVSIEPSSAPAPVRE